MSRFNRRPSGSVAIPQRTTPYVPAVTRSDTVNLAGGQAFSLPPRWEFATLALTSFVEDQFYRDTHGQLDRLLELLPVVGPEFAAKTALYSRNEGGMRSITHVIAAELAHEGARVTPWGRRFYRRIARRPDDMLEILSYYLRKYGTQKQSEKTGRKVHRPLPAAMQWGFKAALESVDGHVLGKYRGGGREVNLTDLMRLVHPRPSEANRAALAALVAGDLKMAGTWESKLSAAGQVEDAEEKLAVRAEAWSDLIGRAQRGEQGGIGYFALLRNLRNIIEQAPAQIEAVCGLLENAEAARRSLVLPFRAAVAYSEIEKMDTGDPRARALALASLSRAVDNLLANVPHWDGRTCVVVDTSGSMKPGYGANAGLTDAKMPDRIASVFAAVLYKANQADILCFGDTTEWFAPDPAAPTLMLADRIRQVGLGGTNFHVVFKALADSGRAYERLVILTDEQGWVGHVNPTGSLEAYVRTVGRRPRVYGFDLRGYGTVQFPLADTYFLAGFSDKTMEIMRHLDEDHDAFIRQIEAVKL